MTSAFAYTHSALPNSLIYASFKPHNGVKRSRKVTGNLLTVAQLAKNSVFTEGQCRGWIQNAGRNGLAHAIERVGSRVLIDMDKFTEWRRQQDAQRRPGGDA